LILTVTTALKLTSYNLAFLTEGNIPEGFVELPQDIINNADQLKVWQEAWDAMFSGQPEYQRKIKFLPEGMKWHPIRKPEDLIFDRFEKWLLLNTCSVLEVPPQAIGFQFDRGKGATEAEWEIGKERGMFPLANFLKEIMDYIIQEDMGCPHLEFIWSNLNPTNKKEESEVFGQLVRTGAFSVDEWRIAEGLEPIGLNHYIMTPVGPFMVEDLISLTRDKETPIPVRVPIVDNPNSKEGKRHAQEREDEEKTKDNIKNKKEEDKEKSSEKITKHIEKATRNEIVEELKRWKKVVANDYKQ
jgi:hypothetical protein